MKMRKTITALVAAALLVSPLTVLAAPAHRTLDSDGSIEFVADESIVPPTRPVYPGLPGTAGPLSIDVVPDFHFGQQFITQDTMTYWAVSQPLGEWGDYVYDNGERVVIGQVRDGYRNWINMPDASAPGGYVTVFCGTNPGAQAPATTTELAIHCDGNFLIETDTDGNALVDGNGDYVLIANWVNEYEREWVRQTDLNGDYIYGPLHAQITDRRGTQDGWNLVVRQDDEFRGEVEDLANPGTSVGVALLGTQITLHGAASAHGELGRGRRLNVERALHALDSGGVRAGVEVFDRNITLVPGVVSPVLFSSQGGMTNQADVDNGLATQVGSIRGMGTHIIDFGGLDDGSGIDGSVNVASPAANHNSGRSTGVSITVPGNTMNDTLYTTTFTWSLANTPVNNPLN